MPFGLVNAPTTFQRAMDLVLSDLSYVICLCHLDDLIVFGREFKWIYEINNIKNERIGRCLFGVWSLLYSLNLSFIKTRLQTNLYKLT